MDLQETTNEEFIQYEPQAFIADPENSSDLVSVTKSQIESLRSGDQVTWDDLSSQFKNGPLDESEKKPTFLTEIEPSRANQEAWDEARRIWEMSGAIAPPYEKDLLCRVAKMSGVLQECVRTYQTIIEGFGHSFSPVLDPDADDAFDQVKWTMWSHRIESGADVDESEPTDEEVNDKLGKLKRDIRFQKMKADRFFRNCGRIKGQRVGFIQLRQRLRQDYEINGEWYLEVLRDRSGGIRRLSYIPSISMRQMPLGKGSVKVEVPEWVDDFTVEMVTERRQFRRYMQVDPDTTTTAYFKEFGDPRILSAESGRYYRTKMDLWAEEPGAKIATEVITDGIPDPETPYGVVRWAANSPAIGGSRKAEEVNFSYFDNKTIPPFLILVSGGRLSPKAQDRIKTYLRQLKGSENFHKLLVLEAAPFAANMPGQPPQRVQIEVVPLIKFLKDDGLFLKYLAFNDTRIGANFSCPPILRGRSEEYVRSVAREALRFFEGMVAMPERHRFDELLNIKLMVPLGLTLVRYKSNGADVSDPEVAAKILDVFLKHGVLTPNDGRVDAEKLLHRELPKMNQDFMNKPLKLSVTETATENNRPQGAVEEEEEEVEVEPEEEEESGEKIDSLKSEEEMRESILSELEEVTRDEA